MKRFLAVISLILILAVLVGCNDEVVPPVGDQPPETPPAELTEAQINGVPLSNYVIVYDEGGTDYQKRAASHIKAQIMERTGIELAVNDDDIAATANEIVVGETSRPISQKLDAKTKGTDFAILADGGSVALEAEYFVIAAAAYYFTHTYVTGQIFDANIPNTVQICQPIVEEAKNFVLLIGDGMGLYQTMLFDQCSAPAADYSDGEDTFYGYYLPYSGYARTNSLSGTTDSAAAGTALSCGFKTKNGYIGMNQNKKSRTSITEFAASIGKATAVMSTEVSTGATPAAFSAHHENRNNATAIKASQNAVVKETGTIIECDYDKYNVSGVNAIQSKITSTLNTLEKDPDGFFIMYEEAHIDKHCHSNDMQKTFNALLRFNQAIGVFMEHAFYNPDTLVLITADHETGALLPNSSGGFSYGSGNHSSQHVPVFAYGMGAEVFDGRVIENVQIPKTFAAFMGNSRFGSTTDGYGPLA